MSENGDAGSWRWFLREFYKMLILGYESLETTRVYLRLTVDDLAQRMEQMSINAYG